MWCSRGSALGHLKISLNFEPSKRPIYLFKRWFLHAEANMSKWFYFRKGRAANIPQRLESCNRICKKEKIRLEMQLWCNLIRVRAEHSSAFFMPKLVSNMWHKWCIIKWRHNKWCHNITYGQYDIDNTVLFNEFFEDWYWNWFILVMVFAMRIVTNSNVCGTITIAIILNPNGPNIATDENLTIKVSTLLNLFSIENSKPK